MEHGVEAESTIAAGEQEGSLRLDGASCSTFEVSHREAWVVWVDGKEWWVDKGNGELMEPINLPIGSLQHSGLHDAQSDQKTEEGY